MPYELAKQLKDAGFPQNKSHWYYSSHTEPVTLWCINAIPEEHYNVIAVPTLEELLEACGEHFWALSRHDGLYYVQGDLSKPGLGALGMEVSPVIAAAKLYLALYPLSASEKDS